VADTPITAALETYAFTSGNAATPAVFTGRTLPKDAAYPAIWLNVRSADPWNDRDKHGAILHIDVQILGEKDQSDKTLENLAWRVWDVLDRTKPTLNGFTCHGCIADPPQVTTADDHYPSYVVQAKLWMQQV
jgi:hypothetical protein